MNIGYACPQCGKTVECPPSSAGTPRKCPHCGHVSLVPQGWNRMFVAALAGAAALLLAIFALVGYQLFSYSSPPQTGQAADLNVKPADADAGSAPGPEASGSPGPSAGPRVPPGGSGRTPTGGVRPSGPASPPRTPTVSSTPPATTTPPPPTATTPPAAPTPPATTTPPASRGAAWARIVRRLVDDNVQAQAKQAAQAGKARFNWPDSYPYGVNVSPQGVKVEDLRQRYGPAETVRTVRRDLGRRELNVEVDEYVYGPITLRVRKGQNTVAYLVAPLGWWLEGIRSRAESAGGGGGQPR